MIKLHIEKAPKAALPSKATLKKLTRLYAEAVLPKTKSFEASIVFLTPKAIADLNTTYRGKKKPTNVLSFPQYEPAALKKIFAAKSKKTETIYLGDVLLCLSVVKIEARREKKPLNHHVMHLIVHGLLHLLGYDHMTGKQAAAMEALEISILQKLGVPNPYVVREPAPKRPPRRIKGGR